MSAITLVEAVNQALAFELVADPSVLVLGEDVGANGGVFRATSGLLQRYGKARVVDTPLAECLIAGMSVGLAAQGMKPVAEFQFMGFMYSAIDQVVNHASRLRYRTRGRLSCPLVLRAPFGAGIHAPEHHSESAEALFAHIPGLRVVVPSSPARAYGLLLAAIRDPDPVIFLEPTRLYRLGKEEVPNNGKALALDSCFVLRDGSDVTLVTWGAAVRETLATAERLSTEGVQAEVIDVATLAPLDMETILDSVEKTGRCVIVHEAAKNCGVGAEIAARLADDGLLRLLAPVRRVTGYDTILPPARLESLFLPQPERICAAVHELLEAA